MPFIIAFGSQYRGGKDTASDYLHQKLNESTIKWRRGSLGYPVKKTFADNFNVSLDFIEEWKVKNYAPPGFDGPIRDGLTKIGDGWRETKSDIWIQKLCDGNKDNLIISDCRYCNESNAFRGKSELPYMKDYSGLTVLLWRPGFENNSPSKSEQELMPFVNKLKTKPDGLIDDPEIPFDLWIKNDGSKEDFLNKIDTFVIPLAKEKFYK